MISSQPIRASAVAGRIPYFTTASASVEAARAIAAVDGAPSPGGGGEIMRASYGTTKYCMSFLRGVTCPDHSCVNLHEWGDEKDCFTKEDLTTLYVTWRVCVVLAEFLPMLLQETYHEG